MLCAGVLGTSLLAPMAHAGLFDDDEARKAILDIRSRLDGDRTRIEGLTRNVQDLMNQNQQLQRDLAAERGQNEELRNQLATIQQSQKDLYSDLDGRMKKLEPQKMTVNGVEGTVQPGEKESFDAALNQFRNGDYKGASASFQNFVKRYPESPYQPDAQFWLGNAQYALRDYKGSNATLQGVVTRYPTHPKAAEAMLAIANNQAEAGQKAAAKKTLESVIKTYANTESAQVAKERLAKLR
ncbi:Tol system periplasmic component YbgF [Pandoraea terrae]|uniref:Cell division coordinator CpoB n=2 Tax=Pandoraea terrae TaxID=1537710 RepID=A0A5E4X5V2_9BURK|nr:Tol system periplasmic component YbgF [Pandoraea terrae]